MSTLQVGNRFRNNADEMDSNENDNERVTPAGSEWRLVEIDGEAHHIVCDATGAWIVPDANELAEQFEPM